MNPYIYIPSITFSFLLHLLLFMALSIFPEQKFNSKGYPYAERVITVSIFRTLPPSGGGGKGKIGEEVLKGVKGIDEIPAKVENEEISFEEAIRGILGEGNNEGMTSYAPSYFEGIKRNIMKEWNLPEGVKEQLKGLKCVILLRMRRDGEVLEVKMLKSSGNELYDLSAIRAIKKAAPFSPFPIGIPGEEIEIEVEF